MASSFLEDCLETLFNEESECFLLRKILLSEILKIQISPKELRSKVELCPTLTSGKFSLSLKEKVKCCPESAIPADYEKFDVELLYKLIRNLCPSLKPTKGWGEKPGANDTKLGDDVERIMQFREELSKFVLTSKFIHSKYKDIWNELESATMRIRESLVFESHIIFHSLMHFKELQNQIADCLEHRTEGKNI